jgi:hypothetical protein
VARGLKISIILAEGGRRTPLEVEVCTGAEAITVVNLAEDVILEGRRESQQMIADSSSWPTRESSLQATWELKVTSYSKTMHMHHRVLDNRQPPWM